MNNYFVNNDINPSINILENLLFENSNKINYNNNNNNNTNNNNNNNNNNNTNNNNNNLIDLFEIYAGFDIIFDSNIDISKQTLPISNGVLRKLPISGENLFMYNTNIQKKESISTPKSAENLIHFESFFSTSSTLEHMSNKIDHSVINLEININQKIDNYNIDDLTNLLLQFDKAAIIIQIIDGKINFIEKKGYETRNQSVIDLLINANNYKKLPNIQFMIFTNDFLPNLELSKNYLFSFCKNSLYESILFPNFNFNHWKESNIDYYHNIYNYFTNNDNKINWESKQNTVFWTGTNTNIIRQKIYNGANIYNTNNQNNSYFHHNYLINLNNVNNINNKNKYYSIEENAKYKYLLNMNGYSYGGRLNYLFLTGSCIIILKNTNLEQQWVEYFYEYFEAGIDYIEILYDDNESHLDIINKINDSIYVADTKKIALNGFNKACQIFNLNNVYEYIYNLLNNVSVKCDIVNKIDKNIFYTSNSNIYLKDRIFAKNNVFSFQFKGIKAEIKIIDSDDNNEIIIHLALDGVLRKTPASPLSGFVKILEARRDGSIQALQESTETIILYNNIFIYNKKIPFILNNFKEQYYEISIINNEINIRVNNQLNIINQSFYSEKVFNILSIEVKTENSEGFWIA